MLSLPCPAKINLFLEIQGRRPDGFHEVGTLLQALETGDTLSAEPWDSIAIEGAEGLTPHPGDNLIARAAVLLKTRNPDRVPAGAGVRFTLQKRLPAGGGLGGGSSNAAAALRLADAVWRLETPAEELRALGAELGSDVPFFLSTPAAFAEGRGERLAPAPAPYPFHVVVATPRCHVETAWAYRQLGQPGRPGRSPGQSRSGPGAARRSDARWPAFRAEYAARSADPGFYATLHNDFDAPVRACFPEIRELSGILESFDPVKTMLSGSGASLFALFRDAETAGKCLAAAAPRCRFAVQTRFRDRGGFF